MFETVISERARKNPIRFFNFKIGKGKLMLENRHIGCNPGWRFHTFLTLRVPRHPPPTTMVMSHNSNTSQVSLPAAPQPGKNHSREWAKVSANKLTI